MNKPASARPSSVQTPVSSSSASKAVRSPNLEVSFVPELKENIRLIHLAANIRQTSFTPNTAESQGDKSNSNATSKLQSIMKTAISGSWTMEHFTRSAANSLNPSPNPA